VELGKRGIGETGKVDGRKRSKEEKRNRGKREKMKCGKTGMEKNWNGRKRGKRGIVER
jgi:hypothetical protein